MKIEKILAGQVKIFEYVKPNHQFLGLKFFRNFNWNEGIKMCLKNIFST